MPRAGAPVKVPTAPTLTTTDSQSFAAVRVLDKVREAALGVPTLGMSPESLLLAWIDWAIHLAGAPGKRAELTLRLMQAMAGYAAQDQSTAPDPRFATPAWQKPPFRQAAQTFLLWQDWWRHATRDVPGTEPHHEEVVSFVARQCLDMLAPSNQLWSNPDVLERTLAQGGANLWRGAMHVLQDLQRKAAGLPPPGSEAYGVGRDVACTPGKVVMRNALVELIQYHPTTATVYVEPVLLISAWIMKFYILDLSPHNSMVRWLLDQGHTVFCLSWRNVGARERDFGLEDYRQLGLMAALDTIGTILPERRVHTLGYCLGGTLLVWGAAAMARAGDMRLATVALLAAQTDFSEPGELQLFIDHAQVHMLDSLMWKRGYLTAEQMSGAFHLLQSRDLIWSRMVHDYLLGERAPLSDLMAWNADTTRMPQRMHSEYLHQLFLNNDLAAGRLLVQGHPVALQNIRTPLFVVGTERDHVAPWRSVYKIHSLVDTEVTFVLSSGGHNVGIVNPPKQSKRSYRVRMEKAGDICLSPDEWFDAATLHEGSWWPAWEQWLVAHSSTRRQPPPAMGSKSANAKSPLPDAPGHYVLQH
jgi:polyhydroxyalkanoate synthase subunit PhaC